MITFESFIISASIIFGVLFLILFILFLKELYITIKYLLMTEIDWLKAKRSIYISIAAGNQDGLNKINYIEKARNDPEMVRARKMLRKLKKYEKPTDDS